MEDSAGSPTMPAADVRQDGVPGNTADKTGAGAHDPVCDFTKVVSLRVEDKIFYVHNNILTKNSGYFSAVLNRLYRGGKSRSITLDDIHPEYFAGYLHILQKSFYMPEFKLQAHQHLYPLVKLLNLWKLADRFDDPRSRSIVEESLDIHWETMAVEYWHSSYLSVSDAGLKERILQLQEAYERCKKISIPFENKIVVACGNCPPQVFAEVFAGLELGAEFRTEVTKSFALRHADPELTKKRKVAKEQSPMTPAKRLKLKLKTKGP